MTLLKCPLYSNSFAAVFASVDFPTPGCPVMQTTWDLLSASSASFTATKLSPRPTNSYAMEEALKPAHA
jgi:hypothetical protein